MSLYSFLGAAISPITSAIEKVSTNNAEVKQRRIQQVIDAKDDIAAWEIVKAKMNKGNWLVYWFSIILSIPLICAFIPPLAPLMLQGFKVLAEMPSFYQYWASSAILGALGIRAIKK